MTDATPDLRLPFQPQSTDTASWPVLISRPLRIKGRVGLTGWLAGLEKGHPVCKKTAPIIPKGSLVGRAFGSCRQGAEL